MNYVRKENTVIIRLDPGDEIVASVLDVAKSEKIGFALISGIGATDFCRVGVFNLDSKSYDEHTFTGNHEITNLSGTLTLMDDAPYQHLHITCANHKGICVGGHLLEGKISLTCEVVISIKDIAINRSKNPEIGINTWNI